MLKASKKRLGAHGAGRVRIQWGLDGLISRLSVVEHGALLEGISRTPSRAREKQT